MVEDRERDALNKARRRACPRSFAWTADLDLRSHRKEHRSMRERRNFRKSNHELSAMLTWSRLHLPSLPPIRTAFDGKGFASSHSNVLSQPTIFCPQWSMDKEFIAPWPEREEMVYEGEGRIKTDRLHRRFPGAPRVDGNDTVAWSHRTFLDPYPFENFYYPLPTEVDVFMRTHWIPGIEFFDHQEDTLLALGTELMHALDPWDEW